MIATPTVDEAELARFAALASQWWDPRGKMAPLHKFNPVRLGYIRDIACKRFGRDPKSSVLDVNCKAHQLDNLYVVDTSFFVSIGAVNPSLTAIANAIRVGDHLLQRLS